MPIMDWNVDGIPDPGAALLRAASQTLTGVTCDGL
jgi:hypothetical protein